MSGHDVAAGLVEDGGFHARVSGAKSFPVAKGDVEGRDVTVTYEDGLEINSGAFRVELVLGDDLGAEGWDIMALNMLD